ncbi:MAG: type VI secretion system protein ImpL [Desulfobacteraceae bacterium]|nr:type VI secretion system protein ImpL [Desulfobacteraceae bacterium]
MKTLFLKLVKIVLLLALALFAFLLLVGAVVWAGWPLWVVFFVAAGIAGVILGLVLLKKLMARRQEQRFVQQIILQDDQSLKSMNQTDQDAAKAMQQKWKEAMEALKRSHLKSRGNPLYVLPWYMVIGTSGSGKTTAIKSARLTSSFEDAQAVAGLSGTKNCDWWFFEQAILIDTAGRYAVPVDETRDREEWQRFLSMLAKYRKKEPLNGLIVTIAADTLNTMEPEAIDRYGKGIRMRIDEIMRVLGSKFPVYAMVTKCDLVHGMTRFCDHLPEESLKQAMGTVNRDTTGREPGTLVSQAFDSMGQRIRDLTLLVLHTLRGSSPDPELLLFPKEFEKLEEGLKRFINRVFQETPYQETPIFRGIFFTSGRQEGTPFSHFLKDLGLISEQEVLPGTSKGLFLHDFFASLLPSDRGLFTLTQQGAEWLRLTKNLGFASFVAIVIAFCGMLSFSFVKNLNTLKQVTVEFATPGILQGELLSDIIALERFSQAIIQVEKENRQWWIPRFGLTESLAVETRLKEKYCSLMHERFIDPLDKHRADAMSYMDAATPEQSRINHMVHLTKRINLIRARLENESLEALSSRPQPGYRGVDLNIGQAIVEEVRQKLKNLYLYALFWRTDTQALNREMNDHQKWLARLITLEGTTMNWLVTWANARPDLEPYTLGGFWGMEKGPADAIGVPPAYTLKGREEILLLVKETEAALTDPLVIAALKREFLAWYRTNYLTTWHRFVKSFPRGKKALSTRDQWKTIAETIHLPANPYGELLTTATKELEPFSGADDLPRWITLLGQLSRVEREAAVIKAQEVGKTGVLRTATDRLKSTLTRGSTLPSGMDRPPETMMAAGKALLTYQEALGALAPMTSSQKAAFNGATSIYTGDPSTNESPFFLARKAVKTLRKTVERSTDGGADEIWTLVRGPLDLFQEFILKESACELQKAWEKKVLVELTGMGRGANTSALVLGEDGLATQFLNKEAAPFIERGLKKGFHAARINNRDIAFEPAFLTFLTRGKVVVKPSRKEYTVKILGYPTNANDEALFQPHATVLILECEGTVTELENLNYPVTEIFKWSFNKKCDLILKIKVSDLILEKKYTGVNSFPRFLKEFSRASGSRTFYPGNFPAHKADLQRMRIKHIKVKYGFKGHAPVVKLLTASPGKVPTEIVRCWD